MTGRIAPPPPTLACDLNALTFAERTEHSQRTRILFSAVRESRELDEGFAFRLDSGALPLAESARWIDFERRCCPFLRFGLDVDANATWLRLTGPAGVKEFLRAELQIQ
jgi:hypothetical protein